MKLIELPARRDPDPHSDPIALALVAKTLEAGFEGLTVEGVACRANVTVDEFHQRFVDLDHCALDVYERHIAAFERRVGEAFNRQPDWRRGIRAAAYSAAAWLESHPDTTRFGSIEVLRMRNEMVRVRREELFAFCAQMIDQGREAAPDPQAVPENASIVAIGSILQLLTRRLQEGAELHFPEVTRESLYGVVRTYLGDDVAREELEIAQSMTAERA